ncbi:MAG TPA: sugar nucleotide-binding protein, partial [Vicinamibacteria bacterium]|nr:sugar nucleotide-binding protein [Vicinamibacteria bacterium]
MKRRLLVTGASGLLGGRLASLLAASFDVLGTRHRADPPTPEVIPLDLDHPETLAAALDRARADAVLHCAALADADACEREPERARTINVDAAAALARWARARSARHIHVSTDLVLGGRRPFSREEDAAEPILAYGRTKRDGEEAVLAEGGLVVRVPLIVGRGHGARRTASEAIADALAARRPLRLYTDQHRTPTDAESIAGALAVLVEGAHQGRFHLGGPERVSRHELGLRVARVWGLPPDTIEAVTMESAPLAVPRPADVSMDSSRAARELGYAPR